MKKNNKTENYLEKCPVRQSEIKWSQSGVTAVTLHIENKGIMNLILQKLIHKPKISYIHLDEIGSYVWPLIDGKRNIIEIGRLVEEHFGDAVQPTYERLAQFFGILESYKFISYKRQ